MVIDASGVLVLRIICAITQILVGILCVCLEEDFLEKPFLITCLHKEIAIPLSAYVRVLVAQTPHDTTWAASLGIIIVDVRREAILEQSRFDTTIADVAVGTMSHSVLIFRMIAERIVASGCAILSVNETLPAFPTELSVHFGHPSMERSVSQLN